MNRYLKHLKDVINKLDGTNPKKDYRLIEKSDIDILIYQYQCELEKMDFSLDKESGGFRHIAYYVQKYMRSMFDDHIFIEPDKRRLETRWSSNTDDNERLEIFMVKRNNKFKIGVCAYRKGFEIAGSYVVMFGKKKLLEFHKPSKRGDILSPIASKVPGFKKSEENFYLLTLPAVSNMAEFKKQIFPKFKSAYEFMHELSKNW